MMRRSRPRSVDVNPRKSMSKQLIIAEKPSVAADIAKALGGFTKHGEYFESDEYVDLDEGAEEEE